MEHKINIDNLSTKNKKPFKVHISNMTGKLQGLQAINQNTTTNAYCQKQSKNQLINFKLKKHDGKIMLENYCLIAEKNPRCNFALWTKRIDVTNKFFNNRTKPKNLILIFSNSKVNKIIYKVPKYFDKVFNVVDSDKFIQDQNCFGKCIDCLKCYDHDKENIIIEPIKKYSKNKEDAKSICEKCYSFEMLQGHRKNCQSAFDRNEILADRLLKDEELPIINAHSFRIHGHGEIITETRRAI